MKFLDIMDTKSAIYIEAMKNHPFNVELSNGTLPEDKFKFYIEQDSLYVPEYARALSIIASKASTTREFAFFVSLANEGLDIEREIHKEYFNRYNIKGEIEPCPTCDAYSNFMVYTASVRSFPEAMAVLLPCFRSYEEVVQHIYNKTTPDNPYIQWINTYAGDEYSEITKQLIEITERAYSKADKHIKENMEKLYIRSNRYELMFWDAAYNQEKWIL